MTQSASLPNEVTQLSPVEVKTYVLDTNVLLHDPTAIAAFAEHRVVIPMTVLEELDHIKDRRDKSVSREARIAIQMIDKWWGPHHLRRFKMVLKFLAQPCRAPWAA